MIDIRKALIDKLLSGRFILTIIGGVAFLYCVFTKSIEGAAITAILVSIFTSYFQRSDRNGANKLPEDKGTSVGS